VKVGLFYTFAQMSVEKNTIEHNYVLGIKCNFIRQIAASKYKKALLRRGSARDFSAAW